MKKDVFSSGIDQACDNFRDHLLKPDEEVEHVVGLTLENGRVGKFTGK
jgi:hypothetical protein